MISSAGGVLLYSVSPRIGATRENRSEACHSDARSDEHTSENTGEVNAELVLQSCVKLHADKR